MFSSAEDTSNLYIGVISGDVAAVVNHWLMDDSDIHDNITLADTPTIKFTANCQHASQVGSWIKTKIHMDKQRINNWTWASTSTRMPPTPPHITRTYQMAVGNTQAYNCIGFNTHGGPILQTVPNNANYNGQVIRLPSHMLQLAQPAPILLQPFPVPAPNPGPQPPSKRKRTNGDN